MNDPFNLQRFVDAQRIMYDYNHVLEELRSGSKGGHWMWFIFPQLIGLGKSELSKKFAISCRKEAETYLGHPILGPRLMECTRLVIDVNASSIKQIFSSPDDCKFLSSMTLFAQVATESVIFREALEKYFGGQVDRYTIERL